MKQLWATYGLVSKLGRECSRGEQRYQTDCDFIQIFVQTRAVTGETQIEVQGFAV